MLVTGKKDDFQTILSQIEGHNGILVTTLLNHQKRFFQNTKFHIPISIKSRDMDLLKWPKITKNSRRVGVSHFKSVSVQNQKRLKAKVLHKLVICHKQHQVKI